MNTIYNISKQVAVLMVSDEEQTHFQFSFFALKRWFYLNRQYFTNRFSIDIKLGV